MVMLFVLQNFKSKLILKLKKNASRLSSRKKNDELQNVVPNKC